MGWIKSMAEIIYLDDLPDCESCNDPTKRRDGVIFDCPGPKEITPTYTCENKLCQQKCNAVASFILRREIADKEVNVYGK